MGNPLTYTWHRSTRPINLPDQVRSVQLIWDGTALALDDELRRIAAALAGRAGAELLVSWPKVSKGARLPALGEFQELANLVIECPRAWDIDWSGIAQCRSLERLSLAGSGSLGFLEALRRLKSLHLMDGTPSDLETIGRAPSLQELAVAEAIGRFPVDVLGGLPGLMNLCLRGVAAKDFGPLASCTELRWLTAGDVGDLGFLKGLRHLRRLWYWNQSGMRRPALPDLSGCVELWDIEIGDVSNLRSLLGIPNLLMLRLQVDNLPELKRGLLKELAGHPSLGVLETVGVKLDATVDARLFGYVPRPSSMAIKDEIVPADWRSAQAALKAARRKVRIGSPDLPVVPNLPVVPQRQRVPLNRVREWRWPTVRLWPFRTNQATGTYLGGKPLSARELVLAQLRRSDFPEIRFPKGARALRLIAVRNRPSPPVRFRAEWAKEEISPSFSEEWPLFDLQRQRVVDRPSVGQLMEWGVLSAREAGAEEWRDYDEEFGCVPGSKVLGWPRLLQDLEMPQCPNCRREMILLLTLASHSYEKRTSRWAPPKRFAGATSLLDSLVDSRGEPVFPDLGQVLVFYCPDCAERHLQLLTQFT